MRGILLVLVLSILQLPAAVGAEGLRQEVRRQAAFARQELAEAECEAALKSAESALRLDPGFIDALLLKAAAYECAGERRQAIATLEAATEVGDASIQERATSELTRLRGRGRRPSRRVLELGPSVGPELVAAGLDPEPFRVRVADALTAGHCALARSTAEELRRLDPKSPDGWGLLGDSLKCSGQNRDAVLAYRRYTATGGADADKLSVLYKLVSGLAVLDVAVPDAPTGVIVRSVLLLEDGVIEPDERAAAGATFRDLPTGVPLQLEVGGRGLQSTTVAIPALQPGEGRAVLVQPPLAGLATLKASDYSAAQVGPVAVVSGAEVILLPPGAEERITAGVFELVVGQGDAAVRIERSIGAGETLELDPTAFRGSTLTLTGLPAGSLVRVKVTGEDYTGVERLDELPLHVGGIDGATGLRLASPRLFDGLIGGAALVALEHPLLGTWIAETVLEPGGPSALALDAATLEGAADITAAWQLWRQERANAQARLRGRAGGFGALGGLLLGGGVALVAAAASLRESRELLERNCKVLLDARYSEVDPLEVAEVCASAAQVKGVQSGLAVGAGLSLGLGLGGVSLAIGFGARAKRVLPPSGDWDPWEMRTEGVSAGEPPTER